MCERGREKRAVLETKSKWKRFVHETYNFQKPTLDNHDQNDGIYRKSMQIAAK